MKLSEKWLREWVSPKGSIETLCHCLTMAGLEVEDCHPIEDDFVIELNITPNRGDCLSIQGVARDVAAITQTKITQPFSIINSDNNPENNLDIHKKQNVNNINITVQAKTACPKYTGRAIYNININAPTPSWIVARLSASGLKTHNCIVDIMNYVMLELGQPMHAFDLDKIDSGQNNKSIIVRQAKLGETLLALDDQVLELNEKHCVIADSKQPLALAGIIGGLDSAVSLQTQSVFLESAFFNPMDIIGVGRKWGIQTDSSFRYERGVDFNLPEKALARATQLILEIARGQPGNIIQQVSSENLPQDILILLNPKKVGKILGKDLEFSYIKQILESLGCSVKIEANSKSHLESNNNIIIFEVFPPSYRFDLKIEEDLIEEVIRIIGYEKLDAHLPDFKAGSKSELQSELAELDKLDELAQAKLDSVPLKRLKRGLVDMGYTEVITYSFVAPQIQALLNPTQEGIALANPISNEMSVMRTSLWPGLIGALQYNQARSQSRIQFFETGFRFIPEKDNSGHTKQVFQQNMLSGLIVGPACEINWRKKSEPFDFYDLKGHIESLFELTGYPKEQLEWRTSEHSALHPFQCAALYLDNRYLGVMGVLHPKITQVLSLEGTVLVFELNLEDFSKKKDFKFCRPSKYPCITRDISIVVDAELPASELISFIEEQTQPLLQKAVIFDIYSGKNIDPTQKSIAIGLTFQHKERTLVEEQIEMLMQNLINALKLKFNAQLRK